LRLETHLMAGPVLYSTNPRFTEIVCDHFRGGRYGPLWCSEFFDPGSQGVLSHAALIAPSSSPKPLYYEILNAVRNSDGGNQKLKEYRKTFAQLARDWLSKGEITQFQHDDIIALVKKYPFTIWEPRLFLLPRDAVTRSGRLHQVPAHKRAGVGMEYQVFDLPRAGFDVIILEP
jgi:hypothetical protein